MAAEIHVNAIQHWHLYREIGGLDGRGRVKGQGMGEGGFGVGRGGVVTGQTESEQVGEEKKRKENEKETERETERNRERKKEREKEREDFDPLVRSVRIGFASNQASRH